MGEEKGGKEKMKRRERRERGRIERRRDGENLKEERNREGKEYQREDGCGGRERVRRKGDRPVTVFLKVGVYGFKPSARKRRAVTDVAEILVGVLQFLVGLRELCLGLLEVRLEVRYPLLQRLNLFAVLNRHIRQTRDACNLQKNDSDKMR